MADGQRCERPARRTGLCDAHYEQRRRDPDAPFRPLRTSPGEGQRVTVRMDTEMRLQVQAAADAAGLEVAEWVRVACREKLTRR